MLTVCCWSASCEKRLGAIRHLRRDISVISALNYYGSERRLRGRPRARASVCMSVATDSEVYKHSLGFISRATQFFLCWSWEKQGEPSQATYTAHRYKSTQTLLVPFNHVLHSVSGFLRLYSIYSTFLTYFLKRNSFFFFLFVCLGSAKIQEGNKEALE